MNEYYPLSEEVLEEVNENYPEHDRNSCSDESPVNVEANGHACARCNALLIADYYRIKKEYKLEVAENERLQAVLHLMESEGKP